MTEIQTVVVETTVDPDVIEISTGLPGPSGTRWHIGGYPIPGGVGAPKDIYLVTTGTTNLGNTYRKGVDGVWTHTGNIRGVPGEGSVDSINGKTGSDIILSAGDISTGVLPIAQVPTGTTQHTVALGNHNHDSVYQGVIVPGTTSQYYRGDKTWQTLDKSAVGLPNVDNTSDANKPVSVATQSALDGKVSKKWSTPTSSVRRDLVQTYIPVSSATTSRYIRINTNIPLNSSLMLKIRVKAYNYTKGVVDGWFTAYMYNSAGGQIHMPRWINLGDADATFIVGSDENNLLVLVLDGAWGYPRVSVDEVEAAFANAQDNYFEGWTIENTPDISDLDVATLASSNTILGQVVSKEPAVPTGTTSQYYRGDKTWRTLDKAAVGLSNVDNTSDLNKPISTFVDIALSSKVSLSSNQTINGIKTFTSAPVVPNGSFTIAKTSGLQVALDSKAPLNSPQFTGTVGGITKSMVGLANVDNTSDLSKPLSVATQNALSLKADSGHLHDERYYTKTFVDQGLAEKADLDHAHDISDVADLQATLDSISSDSAVAQVRDPYGPLGPLFSALARRNIVPAKLAFLGSSTTFGLSATADKFRYVDQMIHALQGAYPSSIPGYFHRPQRFSEAVGAGISKLPGVQGYNGGAGGNTSENYCTSTHLYSLGVINPDCVVHMIGSNDSLSVEPYAVTPTEYKANVTAAIDGIDNLSSSGTPVCHVLVHTYRRDSVTPEHWALYAQALREIADSRDNVLFVDLSEAYDNSLMPGTDPYDLMSTDGVHQTDSGHAIMADLTLKGMGIQGGPAIEDSQLHLVDTFTRGNGAPGFAERPGGAAWNILSGAWEVQSNKLVVTSGGSIVVDAGLSDVDITSVIYTGSGAPLAGHLWRADSDTNRFGTFINRASQTVQIYKSDSGSTVSLASAGVTLSADTDYCLRTIVRGDLVDVYLNGNNVLTYQLTAAEQTKFGVFTKVGFRCGSPTTGLGFWGLAVRRV